MAIEPLNTLIPLEFLKRAALFVFTEVACDVDLDVLSAGELLECHDQLPPDV